MIVWGTDNDRPLLTTDTDDDDDDDDDDDVWFGLLSFFTHFPFTLSHTLLHLLSQQFFTHKVGCANPNLALQIESVATGILSAASRCGLSELEHSECVGKQRIS